MQIRREIKVLITLLKKKKGEKEGEKGIVREKKRTKIKKNE